MVSFDQHADAYRNEVERSIAFAKVDHEQVTERKVEHLLALCERLLGPSREQRLLDVGCGVGLTDSLLTGRVGSLHGIDLSPESVARAAATNPSASYTAFDGSTFPLPDESVDLAFAVCVLHHVPPEARAGFAAELHRVVRPGGIVAVFEHNPLNPLTRVAVNRCELDEGVTLARRGRTQRLLRDAGLRLEEGAYIIFTTSPRWSARADRVLGWCPAGAQYYVAARRGSQSSHTQP
jgi:SAM-dependent methyltransferase